MTVVQLEQMRAGLERRFRLSGDPSSLPLPSLSPAGVIDVDLGTTTEVRHIIQTIDQYAKEEDLLGDDALETLANLIAWSSRNLSQPARSGPILAALFAVRDACL